MSGQLQHIVVLAFSGSPWALGNTPELLLRACAPAAGAELPLVERLAVEPPNYFSIKKVGPGIFQVLKTIFLVETALR